MRSVEASFSSLLRPALMLTFAALVTGCASIQEPIKAIQQAVMPTAAASGPEAKPAAAGTAASVAVAAPVQAPAAEAPVNPQVQRAYDEARRLLAAGRSDDAERAFRALAKSNPELGGPHANLGLIYRQAGKPAEAVAELELAVRASPKQPLYFNQLGIAYRHAGQFAKAREAYENAIDLDGNYATAMLNLGILNDLYLRDSRRALELYERYQIVTASKDAAVTKWVAELKNRKPEQQVLVKREQP
jgi:Flp pilus assembly protein TadD